MTTTPRHDDALRRPDVAEGLSMAVHAAAPTSGVDPLPQAVAHRPRRLDLHLILDNYATINIPSHAGSLAICVSTALHPHEQFWLNFIERWFRDLTRVPLHV